MNKYLYGIYFCLSASLIAVSVSTCSSLFTEDEASESLCSYINTDPSKPIGRSCVKVSYLDNSETMYEVKTYSGTLEYWEVIKLPSSYSYRFDHYGADNNE